MFMSFRNFISRTTLGALLASCSVFGTNDAAAHPSERTWCAQRCDQVIIDWNLESYEVIKAASGYIDPMAASRVLAMVHLAMHDAVNAVEPRYQAYAYSPKPGSFGRGADATVAAAVAAHDVLVALFPTQKALADSRLDEVLLDAGIGQNMAEGKRAGAAAAEAVLSKRASDGSASNASYTPGTEPGQYRFTPGWDFLASPHWGSVTPFVLRSSQQFRVNAPPSLESEAYAKAFNEVKAVGSNADDTQRTQEQTRYAAYWYEFSDIGWNRIARTVARERPQDLWQRARTFALLNAAMADGYIAGWDSKMHYDLWRPVTAIRLADDDNNSQTASDPSWTPYLLTPPVQDHPSTHSVLGAAAAAVLAHAFGTDKVRFTMASSSALPEAPQRSFSSFSSAAWENGDSRVRAGLHFRFAVDAGLYLGNRIGNYTARTLLLPQGHFEHR